MLTLIGFGIASLGGVLAAFELWVLAGIVATALILHYAFAVLGITPESARAVQEVAQFKLDYTFWMNLLALGTVAVLLLLDRAWHRRNEAMATRWISVFFEDDKVSEIRRDQTLRPGL